MVSKDWNVKDHIERRKKSLIKNRRVVFEMLRDELERKENSTPGGYTLDAVARLLRDVIEIDTLIMEYDVLDDAIRFNGNGVHMR